jgi:DNA-binding NarL/FixJ family response regulator
MEPADTDGSPAGGLTLERVLALEEQVRELRHVTASLVPVARSVTIDGLPQVLDRRSSDRRSPTALDRLTDRERDVLELMAQGCSNAGVAYRLHLSERTVEATSAHLFRKLGLEPSQFTNRRVLAVLTYLAARGVRT